MKWLDRLFTKFGGMLGMAWLKIHCGVHTRLTLETEEKLQRLWYPFSWKAETEAHKVCVAVDWERSCAQTELLSKSEPQTESHRYFQLSCESRFGIVCVCVQSLSCVRSFVIPWTVACQAPLSVGFPRQEYWSGLPFPSPMHESEKSLSHDWLVATPWNAAHQAPLSMGFSRQEYWSGLPVLPG